MKTLLLLLFFPCVSFAQWSQMDSAGYTIYKNEETGARRMIHPDGTADTRSLPPSIGLTGASATSATTGTMAVPMKTRIITVTPTGNCTFNATGGVVGQVVTFVITTSGVTSRVLTFGTNFKPVGTLATGTTNARRFCVSFIYDGTVWIETARTAAIP